MLQIYQEAFESFCRVFQESLDVEALKKWLENL